MKTLQRCTITVNSNDGIASIKKDYFSDFRFPYNTNHLVFQPMTQYLCWINNDNELINNFPTRSDGLILRTRTQLDDSGMITSVVYSVITRIELQSYEKETELLLRYYSNSEDNNLEILQDETYIIE